MPGYWLRLDGRGDIALNTYKDSAIMSDQISSKLSMVCVWEKSRDKRTK